MNSNLCVCGSKNIAYIKINVCCSKCCKDNNLDEIILTHDIDAEQIKAIVKTINHIQSLKLTKSPIYFIDV